MPAKKKPSKHWTRLPFRQAIAFLQAKRIVTPAEFQALSKEARNLAANVSGVQKLDILQTIIDSLVQSVSRGETIKDFAQQIDDTFSRAGLDPLSPWRLETIFRTSVQSAYGRGRWEQGTDPEISDEIWGWRYVSVGDDRVREEHAALDGKVFKTGEADEFFPPWDFNCRCTNEWISKLEAEELGLEESSAIPDEVVEAAVSSEFASPALTPPEYRPDLSGYHPALQAEFLRDRSGRE